MCRQRIRFLPDSTLSRFRHESRSVLLRRSQCRGVSGRSEANRPFGEPTLFGADVADSTAP